MGRAAARTPADEQIEAARQEAERLAREPDGQPLSPDKSPQAEHATDPGPTQRQMSVEPEAEREDKEAARAAKEKADRARKDREKADREKADREKAEKAQKKDKLRVLPGGSDGARALPASPVEAPQPAPAVGPARPVKRRFRLSTRSLLIGSFAGLVLLPATLSGLYMAFVAADQYHSTASFAVRSIDASASSDILGMFTQASSGNTTSDSYILIDFIRSERMLRAIEARFDLASIFAVRGYDYVYGQRPDQPVEDRLRYWRRMVEVSYDHASGIMELRVYAFDPDQARAISAYVIEQSEQLINALSRDARRTVLQEAEREIVTAEERLVGARAAVRRYRDATQEVDPVEGARLTGELISKLELDLAQLSTSLSTARSQMSDDSPRIKVLKTQIESTRQQIALERARIGGGRQAASTAEGAGSTDTAVAGRLQEFEALDTKRGFAERAYSAALTSMESARIDANNRQRYLATFIEPTLSERAQYPARLINSLLAALAFLFAWLVAVMAYYNIKDRT